MLRRTNPFAACRFIVGLFAFLLTVGVTEAGPSKIKMAKSSGNNQTTFVMKLDSSKCPFCNLSETTQNKEDPNRATGAGLLPALIGPGTCGEPSATWTLNADPFVSETFIPKNSKGVFLDAKSPVWGDVASGLYLEKSGSFKTTLSQDAAAGSTTAVINGEPQTWPSNLKKGALVVVDDRDHREIAKVVDVKGNTVTIQAGGQNLGWAHLHVANVPFALVDKASDCEAGKAEIVLDRAFRYGFCDRTKYNIGKDETKKDDAGNATDKQLVVLNSNFDKSASDFYIINVVVWRNQADTYTPSSSDWYVYNRGDHGHWYRQKLAYFDGNLRIYGSKKPIGLLAIHIRPMNTDTDPWPDFQKLGITYSVSVKSKTPANVSNLQTAISIISEHQVGNVSESAPTPDGFFGTMFFSAKAAADITITADVDFSKTKGGNKAKSPDQNQISTSRQSSSPGQPASSVPPALDSSTAVRSTFAWAVDRDMNSQFQNSLSSGGPNYQDENASADRFSMRYVSWRAETESNAFQSSGKSKAKGTGDTNQVGQENKNSQNNDTKQTTKTSSDKNQNSTTPQNPSTDCQTASADGKKPTCKFTATINDEDLYHWDVSFAVPFHSVSELNYNQPSGTGTSVVPKNVTRLNAYALFDIYPVAADIVTPPIISVPHVFVGLPISGKVFNKPMFGIADGFNLKKVSFLSFLPLQLNFFGGVIYNKEFNQIPGTTGSASVVGHRVWKGAYGIEIPVSQFKGLLSTKKTAKDSAGSKPADANSTN